MQLVEDIALGRVTPELKEALDARGISLTRYPYLPREQSQVAVRLPDALIAELDRRATAKGMKRSALIRQVLDAYIAEPTS
jgi:predicted DNA binding CopG/RHH family protein